MKRDNRRMGIKLVRGAYMSEENPLALRLHLESPIFMSKKATD